MAGLIITDPSPFKFGREEVSIRDGTLKASINCDFMKYIDTFIIFRKIGIGLENTVE
jgi:hypothetical protein